MTTSLRDLQSEARSLYLELDRLMEKGVTVAEDGTVTVDDLGDDALEAIFAAIADNDEAFASKVGSYAYLVQMLDADAARFKADKDFAAKRQKSAENLRDRLKQRLGEAMLERGMGSIKTPAGTVKPYRSEKTTVEPRVPVSELPDEYRTMEAAIGRLRADLNSKDFVIHDRAAQFAAIVPVGAPTPSVQIRR